MSGTRRTFPGGRQASEILIAHKGLASGRDDSH
jgi:hypothetical protein